MIVLWELSSQAPALTAESTLVGGPRKHTSRPRALGSVQRRSSTLLWPFFPSATLSTFLLASHHEAKDSLLENSGIFLRKNKLQLTEKLYILLVFYLTELCFLRQGWWWFYRIVLYNHRCRLVTDTPARGLLGAVDLITCSIFRSSWLLGCLHTFSWAILPLPRCR